jgi:hypothetical protein
MILVSAVACDNAEIRENYYSMYQDLRQSDEPGNWIPSFIPHSATEIREKHKIDTGAELLTFYYSQPPDLSLNGHCKKANMDALVFPDRGFLNVAWWPEFLVNNQVKAKHTDRYEFYRCERQSFLALTKASERYQAFYWRISLTDARTGPL